MHTDHPWGGGGLFVNPGTTVRNCWIEGNEAAQRGGGIYAHEFLVVENCTIVGNKALGLRRRNPNGPDRMSMEEGGGGAYCDFGARLLNCLIYRNHAKIGGGAVLSTAASAHHCTITENTADVSGGGIHTMGRPITILNSIVYGNTRGADRSPDDVFASHYYHVDIHQLTKGLANLENSCVGKTEVHQTRQGFYLGPTARWDPSYYGNALNVRDGTDSDPRFEDPAKHNYRLRPDSPCVDRAAPRDWPEDATDLDGNPRVQGEGPDMGAFESAPSAK
jgi:hypothetical protein